MPNRHMKYVLVGAGAASASAAAAIRAVDPAGPLLLVGQEINRPYHRPHLSRDYLLGRRRHEDLFTHDPAWFRDRDIDLRTHRRAAQLDCARRSVSLDDGQEISFDTLLLATGAAPRRLDVPGADLPNVFYLRTVEDADRLRHAIDAAHKQNLPPFPSAGTQRVPGHTPRVAVIGAGLLGMELASTLTQLGLHVDLFSKDPHPYHKYAGDLPGRSVARYLETHGVTLHASSPVASLQGDGRAQRVLTTTGQSIPCDLVVVAIGIVPHKELLRGTPIAAERAILTDPFGRTNVPGIFAAGDCAARFDPLFGKHRLDDHWDAALDTGAIAGATMAGAPPTATGVPPVTSFSTTVFDLTLRSYGEPRLASRRLARATPAGTPGVPLFTEFALDPAHRLTQILTSDPSADPTLCRALVAARLPLDGQEESLKDPAVLLARFLPT